jgi:hypothetical protein
MEISIGSLLQGARQAAGAVAIIDVFRAFTTSPFRTAAFRHTPCPTLPETTSHITSLQWKPKP